MRISEENPPCKMLLGEGSFRICRFGEVKVKWLRMELLMVVSKPSKSERMGLEITKRISFSFALRLRDAKFRRWCFGVCLILALSSYGLESRPSIGSC